MDCLGITLLVLLYFICVPTVAFLQQYIGVRGRLVCGKLPLSNTTVTLWDDNVIASDVLLAEAKTDRNGRFEIEGGTTAFFTMDVRLKADHSCNEKRQCYRRVDLPVPSCYVYRGSGVVRWFEAGTLNMSFPFPGEERICTR
ncbi:hypothetical protein Y032_0056g2705 [Ancylostoma ceylanicum]|nr:hypothetical protein Y032_0056g2705 [Ancylostoma ceylanicum]